MKSKIIKYSVALTASVFAIIAFSMRAKSQQPTQVFESLSTSLVQANPMSQGQVNYIHIIWKDSDDASMEALKCYWKGEYKDAERLSKKAMDKAPLTPDGKRHQSNYEAVKALAMVYIRQEKYSEVIKLYDDLYAANPRTFSGDSMDPLNLALSYLRLGKYDQALQSYKSYERLTNRRPAANIPVSDYPGIDTPKKLEATILEERGSAIAVMGHDEGLIDLRCAHELAPKNPIIAARLADNLSSSNEKEKAEKLEMLKIVIKNGHGDMVTDAKSQIPYNNGK